MDEITSALRGMYEEFPYPPVASPEQRIGWNVDLLLSYGRKAPPSSARKSLVVLDAGCGRGAGIIGAAALQPHVQFVGADINRVALNEAREQVKARGLRNVELHEVDLNTLEGLAIPDGGFDVIFSSGVVHHMPDPARGLGCLSKVLAPHGMLQLMVYGRRGREPLYRMVRAMDQLIPRSFPVRDRLMVARELTRGLSVSDAVSSGPWSDIKNIGDVELVDRYLNVNERSYDIPELFDLIDKTDLRFVRWTEPNDWDLTSIVKSSAVIELSKRLSDRERFALVDELAWRPRFELVVCGKENEAKPAATVEELMNATIAVSPEVSFSTEVRNVSGGQRVENISVRVRKNPPMTFEGGLVASALVFLKDTSIPFKGSELVFMLGTNGIPLESAQGLLASLIHSEILFTLSNEP